MEHLLFKFKINYLLFYFPLFHMSKSLVNLVKMNYLSRITHYIEQLSLYPVELYVVVDLQYYSLCQECT